MTWRDYDIERDRSAIQRIWREVGWLKPGKELGQDLFVSVGRAIVADMDGTPECLVVTAPGHVRHLNDDLPFCCVHGVTTSYIARQQGLAGRLTAQAVANGAADGALMAGLGMFDQGYYDKFGFGSGAYSHWAAFDPARLKVKVRPRAPRRLTADDYEIVHAARLARPAATTTKEAETHCPAPVSDTHTSKQQVKRFAPVAESFSITTPTFHSSR